MKLLRGHEFPPVLKTSLMASFIAVCIQGCSLFKNEGPAALINTANKQIAKVDVGGAEDSLKHVIDSDSAPAYKLFALTEITRCYLHERRFSDARFSAQQALALERHNRADGESKLVITNLLLLAQAQAGLGDYKVSLSNCRNALRLTSPNQADNGGQMSMVKVTMADTLARQGDYAPAIKLYQQCIPLHSVLTRLGLCLRRAGRSQEALDVLRRNLPGDSQAELAAGYSRYFDIYIDLLRELDPNRVQAALQQKRNWELKSAEYRALAAGDDPLFTIMQHYLIWDLDNALSWLLAEGSVHAGN